MLYREHLTAELNSKRESFVRFERVWRDDACRYVAALQRMAMTARGEIEERAAQAAQPTGSLPSPEFDRTRSIVVPFRERWRSHEEARQWALKALAGRTTFAADGSQLLLGREVSVPVAAVQVAAFENPHRADADYRKTARFSIIAPDEIFENINDGATPEAIVSLRRFKIEIETIEEFLRAKRNWRERGERVPVAFFDGSLLISHTRPRTRHQKEYINLCVSLIELSRETEIPVIGFIDQSYAPDLVNLVDAIEGNAGRSDVGMMLSDAQILRACAAETDGRPLLAAWGDRTTFCYCVRPGLRENYMDTRGKPLVGFTYLQTMADGAPARLDIPSWVEEAGLLDEVMDTVRAECVVGGGYPYALETADAAAVITMRDREVFLRAVHEFAARSGFPFHISRKAMSKSHRR